MKLLRIFTVIIFFLHVFTNVIFSQTSVAQAQAIFIYNFTRMIEWPDDYKSGDFIIGVLGSGELLNELKPYVSSKMVGSQPIKAISYSSVQDISRCHILFVGYSKTKDLPAIVAKLGNNSTLIITEKKGSLDAGATINFVMLEDKLKFELKVGNATKYGLKITSKLEMMAYAKY